MLALLQLSKANSFYNDSLRTAIKASSGIKKIKLINKLAGEYKGIYPDSALVLGRESESLMKDFNNDTLQSDIAALFGECYTYLGKYDSAAIFYLKAIDLAEKIKHRKKLASYNNGLGMLFFQIGDFEKAIVYMQKASKIKLEDKDLLYYAAVNSNIAGAMQRLGRYREALALLRDSEQKVKAFKNTVILANIYNMIGGIFQYEKNLDSAQFYYERNVTMITDKKDYGYKFVALANLGEIMKEKGKLEKAETYLLEALELSQALSRNAERATIYESLSNLYEQKKDYERALEYKKKNGKLKDSLFSNKESLIKFIEGKYEAGQKDLQIKSQELALQKEKTNKFQIALFSIALMLVLIVVLIYFWFSKRLEKKVQETKEKFFTNVMHEVRTPLSMIRAPLQVLKGKLSDEEKLYNIDLADRNATRLNELMDQMLDISKFNNLTYVLNNTVGDLELFIEEVVSDYERLAAEKEIVFKKQISHLNSLVYFDKDALQKIIGNLLSNAIKYTKPGGSISFSLKEERKEQHTEILVAIKDTGIGIPRNEQKKLFTRFYRSEKVSAQTKGIGIGLSLVKDLVDVHQGTIEFVSEEGKGTEFRVKLNLKLGNTVLQENYTKTTDNEKGIVLLVEDNKDVIEFVSSLLVKEGFYVAKAANGRIGLDVLKEITPDLIVTDVMMDEMDGLAFIKEIKSIPGLDHIPVIALSAKAAEKSRTDIMKAGAQMYLTKPFLPQELLAVIQNQLELIAKLRQETKQNIEKEEPALIAEQRFTSKEPYIQKLFDLIFKHYERSDLTVEFLADLMATNRSHFQRKVKSLTGYSPSDFIKLIRLEKSKEFLINKKGNVTEVAYMCGFSSQSYFTRCFTEHFKASPSDFI